MAAVHSVNRTVSFCVLLVLTWSIPHCVFAQVHKGLYRTTYLQPDQTRTQDGRNPLLTLNLGPKLQASDVEGSVLAARNRAPLFASDSAKHPAVFVRVRPDTPFSIVAKAVRLIGESTRPGAEGEIYLSVDAASKPETKKSRTDLPPPKKFFPSMEVDAIDWSPDGDLIAAGGGKGAIRIFEVSSGKLVATLEGHQKPVFTLSWSPDGSKLASGGMDGKVLLWDVKTWKLRETLHSFKGYVFSVRHRPDGKRMAVGSDGALTLLDSKTGKEEAEQKKHVNAVFCVDWTKDGGTVVAGRWDGSAAIYDEKLNEKHALKLTRHWIRAIAVSPCGSKAAATGTDGRVYELDLASAKLKRSWEAHAQAVWSIAYSPRGNLLATASGDGTLRVWDADSGMLRYEFKTKESAIFAVRFSRDGRNLAAGCGDEENCVLVWNLP